jgi:hypothetical protein
MSINIVTSFCPSFPTVELLTHDTVFPQNEALLWGRLLHKAVGDRSEWEYPFAVAGINVTFMLEELLEMRDPRTRAPLLDRLPVGAAARGFVGLLKESDTVFEEA